MLRATILILVAMVAVPASAGPCVPHRISVHVIDDPGGYMRAVQAQIKRDEKTGALEPNVVGIHETLIGGKISHVDYAISSSKRDVITAYLAKLATGRKPLVLDRAHAVVFQTYPSDTPDAVELARVVSAAPVLDDRSFTTVSVEPLTKTWSVTQIGLTAAAMQVWSDATANMVDHKFAVVIDGEVIADPRIVRMKVTSGGVRIVAPTASDATAIAKRIQAARCQ